MRILRLVPILVAATCVSSASRADDALVAQSLFDEGRALMDAGRIPEACTKLAKSQISTPAGGRA